MLKNSLYAISFKIASLLSSILISVILARLMGVDLFGKYIYTMSILQISLVFIVFGFPSLLVRNIAKYSAENKYKEIKGLVRSSFNISIFISIFVILVASICYYQFYLLPYSITIYTYFLCFEAILALIAAIISGYGFVLKSQFITKIFRSVLLLCFLSMLWILDLEISINKVISYHIAACSITILCSLWVIKNRTNLFRIKGNPVYKTKRWLRSAITFMFLSGVWMLFGQVDLMMLGYFGVNSDVGFYRIAAVGGGMVFMVIGAINELIRPKIAQLGNKKDKELLQTIVTTYTRQASVISIIAAIGIFLFSSMAINLVYGNAYLASSTPMIILAIGYALISLIGPSGVVLSMIGYEAIAFRVQIISLILNIILNYVYIPLYGATGAAIATSFSFIFLFLTQFILIYKIRRVRVFVI